MLKDIIRKILSGTKKVVTLPTVRTSSGEFLLKKTDFGLVSVEFAVVQKIAERALSQVEGIQEVTVSVEKISNSVTPLKIRLTMALTEGYSAPRASELADTAINAALKDLLQLEFYVPVEVKVKQIAQPATQERRRVR